MLFIINLDRYLFIKLSLLKRYQFSLNSACIFKNDFPSPQCLHLRRFKRANEHFGQPLQFKHLQVIVFLNNKNLLNYKELLDNKSMKSEDIFYCDCDVSYYRNQLKFNAYLSKPCIQNLENLKKLIKYKQKFCLFYKIDLLIERNSGLRLKEPFIDNFLVCLVIIISILSRVGVASPMPTNQMLINNIAFALIIAQMIITRIVIAHSKRFLLQILFIILDASAIIFLYYMKIITLILVIFFVAALALVIVSFIILYAQHYVVQSKKKQTECQFATKFQLSAIEHSFGSNFAIVLWIFMISFEFMIYGLFNEQVRPEIQKRTLNNSICCLFIILVKLPSRFQFNPYLCMALIKKQIMKQYQASENTKVENIKSEKHIPGSEFNTLFESSQLRHLDQSRKENKNYNKFKNKSLNHNLAQKTVKFERYQNQQVRRKQKVVMVKHPKQANDNSQKTLSEIDFLPIKFQWRPLVLYSFLVLIFVGLAILSVYFLLKDQYVDQLITVFTMFKMVLMIIYAEAVEVQIGQSINYKKYPNIIFVFDILTNLPAISMMLFPNFFRYYGSDIGSLIFNGSLFIIVPQMLSVAYYDAYSNNSLGYNMTMILFLIVPQCLRQTIYLMDHSKVLDILQWFINIEVITFITVVLIIFNKDNLVGIFSEICVVVQISNKKIYLIEKLRRIYDKSFIASRCYFCISVVTISSAFHLIPNNFSGFKLYYFIIYGLLIYLYFLCCKFEIESNVLIQKQAPILHEPSRLQTNNQIQLKSSLDHSQTGKQKIINAIYPNKKQQQTEKKSVVLNQKQTIFQKLNILPLIIAVSLLGIFIASLFCEPLKQYEAAILFCFVISFLYFGVFQCSTFVLNRTKKYINFTKFFIINLVYWVIIFPFLVFFCVGYLFSGANHNFIISYGIGVFLYISVLATSFGIIVHYILNLNAIGKKDLYISQYMGQKLKQMKIKDNPDAIITISRIFQILNLNQEELKAHLQKETLVKIQLHEYQDVQYDYSLEIPLDADKQSNGITNSPFNEQLFRQIFLQRGNSQKEPIFISASWIRNKAINNVSNQREGRSHEDQQQYTNKQNTNNRIQLSQQSYALELIRQENANLHSLENLHESLTNQLKTRYERYKDKIFMLRRTPRFKQISQNYQQICNIMHRMFIFLSEPLNIITQNTFNTFVNIIQTQRGNKQKTSSYEISSIYKDFSTQNQFKENNFRNFIEHYVNSYIGPSFKDSIKYFCLNFLYPMALYSEDALAYYLFRKKIDFNDHFLALWKIQIIEQQIFQLKILSQMKKNKIKQKADIFQKKEGNIRIQRKTLIHSVHSNKKSNFKSKNILDGKGSEISCIKKMKPIKLRTSQQIYKQLSKWVAECFKDYENEESESFEVKKISCRLSNVIAFWTKIIDFGTIYIYPCIIDLISYYYNKFAENNSFLFQINYKILIFGSFFLVALYVFLIFYHYKDFEEGTLGVDQMHRTLTYGNFKYYSTFLLFVLGSSVASTILNISLNSYICDSSSGTLRMFPSQSCFTKLHFIYMFLGILIIISYYPLSIITFPFSSFLDRGLQIKYRSQYEVVYIESKLLVIGLNAMLTSYDIKIQSLIMAICRGVLCLILYSIFARTRPCSFSIFNTVEDKTLMIIIILNLGVALNFFSYFYISLIVMGAGLGIFILFIVIRKLSSSKKIGLKTKNDNLNIDENFQQNFAKQSNSMLNLEYVKKNQNKQIIITQLA